MTATEVNSTSNPIKKYKMFPEIDNKTSVLNYWWFRYLMVTELYLVEKWERVTIHVIFAIIFAIFWFFNYSVMLNLASNLFGSSTEATSEATTQSMLINDVIIPAPVNSYSS